MAELRSIAHARTGRVTLRTVREALREPSGGESVNLEYPGAQREVPYDFANS
jgi:hypothetical protein